MLFVSKIWVNAELNLSTFWIRSFFGESISKSVSRASFICALFAKSVAISFNVFVILSSTAVFGVVCCVLRVLSLLVLVVSWSVGRL